MCAMWVVCDQCVPCVWCVINVWVVCDQCVGGV